MIEDTEIISLVKKALNSLLATPDIWLLKNDLSEQSISHRIAIHLENLFPKYNVDCEYNGDVDRENNKKAISILKSDLKEIFLLREKEEIDLERELTSRAVFPDVIIHERGTNSRNLCILEVKKSTSKVSFDYDFIKLKSYTSNQYGNNLCYQLGVFIEAKIDTENPSFDLKFFKLGKEINESL